MTSGSFGEDQRPATYSATKRVSERTHSNGTRSYRISQEEFIRSTSPKDREILRKILNESILFLLESEKAVHLDGFGIIYPERSEHIANHPLSDAQALIRKETTLTAGFEKCYDLVSYHREEYPEIAETNDVARRIYPRLPLNNQVRWSEWDTCRYLRGLIQSIRDEVVIDGISRQLGALGDLFSLHNRQGDSLESWFAGADIYLRSSLSVPIACEQGRTYELPVLTDAWEPLSASFGPPVHTLDAPIAEELKSLGFADDELDTSLEDTLEIGVFFDAGGKRFIFCTRGVRFVDSKVTGSTGFEFVFQTPASEVPIENVQSDPVSYIPKWPIRALVMGWLLLQSSKTKSIEYGAGLKIERPLNEEGTSSAPNQSRSRLQRCSLNGIVATKFELTPIPQRTESGSFKYINLIGITEDEGRVAELYGSEHLQMLLQVKNYHQVTNPYRKSVIARTGLLPEEFTRSGDSTEN